jgi:hypothetical protein
MMFELWDSASGSAMGAYTTESEALAVIRATIELDGPDAVATYALLRVNAHGRAKAIAQGDALAERALTAVPAAPPAKPEQRQTPVPA